MILKLLKPSQLSKHFGSAPYKRVISTTNIYLLSAAKLVKKQILQIKYALRSKLYYYLFVLHRNLPIWIH